MKNNRKNRNLLRNARQLSTLVPAEPDFIAWLNAAVRDERWRALIRERLVQAELAEIQF